MSNPRKIMLFGEDEATSVIAQREDLASNEAVSNVFGIDLGTTNSAISIVKVGEPEIITLASGKKTIPSCVMWKDGEFIVGDEAYNNRSLPNVQYSVKRLMEDAHATVTFTDGDKSITMTPAEVSAEILKGIIKATNGIYGNIHDVVVTVPAYFNDIGKRNTMKACELAGLNLIALENEPSAAALEYDLPADKSSEDIIIYDLGGGTFDVTLARIIKTTTSDSDALDIYGFDNVVKGNSTSKIIKPIALGGDGRLGGDDIDMELLRIVLGKLGITEDQLSERDIKSFTHRLEQLKKAGVNQTYESTFTTTLLNGTELNKTIYIEPDDFVQSVIPIYERTKKELDRVLAESPNTASKILLVGGSTKNPIIQDMLRRDYSTFEISSVLNPDLVVSTGASVKGRILKYGDSSISSFDILPMTIGILESSTVYPVIEKNTELPVSNTQDFTTTYDNQEEMRVAIYQGNSIYKDECVYLGDLILTDIPKEKAGVPKLVITLTITANSVLMCEATINGIKKTLQLNLTSSNDKAPETKTYTREEKQVIRWREFARTLGGDNGAKLTEMLDQYPVTVSADQIKEFIRSVRKES